MKELQTGDLKEVYCPSRKQRKVSVRNSYFPLLSASEIGLGETKSVQYAYNSFLSPEGWFQVHMDSM